MKRLGWEHWSTTEIELVKKLSDPDANVIEELQRMLGGENAHQAFGDKESEDYDESESFEDVEEELPRTGGIEMFANDLEMHEIQLMTIETPFGFVSIDSKLKPSDRWDCWIGYANFDVSGQEFEDTITTIDGVEAFQVMSRYTFCIGIGKMFEFGEVRKDIENAFCDK